MKAPQRFIYVIGPLEGAQKVGLTTDPKGRLATLQTGCPHELVLHVAVRVPFDEAHAVERRAHRMLARCCARNEWFDTTPTAAMSTVLLAAKPLPVAYSPARPAVLDALPLFSFERTPQSAAPTPDIPRRSLWRGCRAALSWR